MLLVMHNTFSLEVQPPKSWQQQFNLPPGVLYQFIAPRPQDNFSPNLNISKAKAKVGDKDLKTPTEIGSFLEKTQVRIFPMFKVLEKKERKIDSQSGALVVISYAYGALDLSAFQFAFRRGDEIVTVVYTCLAKDLDGFRPEFEKSLATLKTGPAEKGAAVKP